MSFLLNRHYREWLWIAGENGKPGVTADLTAAAESTRMVTDPLVEVAGTNAASAGVSLNAEGGIDLVTAGGDNDQIILIPHELANANQCHGDNFALRTNREAEFECALKIPSVITTLKIMCGLKQDDSPADLLLTDLGLSVFNFDTDDADTTWGFVGDIVAGGSDVDIDTGVPVVAGDVVHFSIKYTGSGRCEARINDKVVAHLNMTANGTGLIPFIAAQSLDAGPSATSEMTVYGWRVSRSIGQAR